TDWAGGSSPAKKRFLTARVRRNPFSLQCTNYLMSCVSAQVCPGEIPLPLSMRKAHSTDVMELQTHQPDASAANRALDLLGRGLNLFTEKKEIGKPGDFDHMADEELIEFVEAQGEVGHKLERQLLPPPEAARMLPSTRKCRSGAGCP